jgi:hypothetical protein
MSLVKIVIKSNQEMMRQQSYIELIKVLPTIRSKASTSHLWEHIHDVRML